MLRPEVIRDLRLAGHGLRMVACEPGLRWSFEDGRVIPWWTDHERTVAEWRRISAADAATFVRVDDRLKQLARYLQPLLPGGAAGRRMRAAWRGSARRFGCCRRFQGITGDEIAETGLVPHRLASASSSTGTSRPRRSSRCSSRTTSTGCTRPLPARAPSLGPLFHLLSGGEHDVQGFFGHVIGGMGAITQAMAAAGAGSGRRSGPRRRSTGSSSRGGRARGVALEDGTEIGRAPSCRTPTRSALSSAWSSRRRSRGVPRGDRGDQDGRSCAKVNMVLAEEPRCDRHAGRCRPAGARSSTLVPTLEFAERCTTRRNGARSPRSSGSIAWWLRTSTDTSRPRARTS